MKKVLITVLITAMVVLSAITLVACEKNDATFIAEDAIDLLKEDFGIAVTKGNAQLLAAVNTVIDEWNANGTMQKYKDYYQAVAEEEETGVKATVPDGLKVEWDFGTATETITVYTESGFAPYEFIYDGKVIGVDIAIMSQVALNEGKKIDIKDILFDTIPTSVSTATGDAVGAAGITINEERKEQVDFSNPYESSTLVVVSKDGQYKSVADLAGKKVGVQEGTSGDLIISAAAGAGYKYVGEDDEEKTVVAAGAEVKQYKQYALALADLKNGRIDAILMDKIPAQLMLKK
ncbi:MAG: transporter substrate-binding domain-containing protein [Christensenellales bacterium]